MQKREFLGRVSAKCGLSKRASEQAMDAVFDTLAEVLAEQGRLQVSGLGVFSTAWRAPRTARNPRTGELIRLAPTVSAVFRPSAALKARLNPEEQNG